jgi:hypothetical protein
MSNLTQQRLMAIIEATRDMQPSAFKLACALATLATDYGEVRRSVSDICAYTSIGLSTYKEAMRDLESAGMVRRDGKGPGSLITLTGLTFNLIAPIGLENNPIDDGIGLEVNPEQEIGPDSNPILGQIPTQSQPMAEHAASPEIIGSGDVPPNVLLFNQSLSQGKAILYGDSYSGASMHAGARASETPAEAVSKLEAEPRDTIEQTLLTIPWYRKLAADDRDEAHSAISWLAGAAGDEATVRKVAQLISSTAKQVAQALPHGVNVWAFQAQQAMAWQEQHGDDRKPPRSLTWQNWCTSGPAIKATARLEAMREQRSAPTGYATSYAQPAARPAYDDGLSEQEPAAAAYVPEDEPDPMAGLDERPMMLRGLIETARRQGWLTSEQQRALGASRLGWDEALERYTLICPRHQRKLLDDWHAKHSTQVRELLLGKGMRTHGVRHPLPVSLITAKGVLNV